jgi:hypothetical protein
MSETNFELVKKYAEKKLNDLGLKEAKVFMAYDNARAREVVSVDLKGVSVTFLSTQHSASDVEMVEKFFIEIQQASPDMEYAFALKKGMKWATR